VEGIIHPGRTGWGVRVNLVWDVLVIPLETCSANGDQAGEHDTDRQRGITREQQRGDHAGEAGGHGKRGDGDRDREQDGQRAVHK
jgi:hypothetical protein